MSTQPTPRVSAHAGLRLVQRAGIDAGPAARVWRAGTPVDVEGHDYHHARYDAEQDVLLLARGGVITTVLDAAREEFREVSR